MSTTTVKPDVADDTAPSSPGDRAFTIPAFSPDNEIERARSLVFSSDVLTAGGASVANGKYSAQLYLYVNSAWVAVGPKLVDVARGRKVVLFFRSLTTDTQAFVRLTGITGTSAASMTSTVDVEYSNVPSNGFGVPQVALVGDGSRPLLAKSIVRENSRVAKATAGVLYSVICHCKSTASGDRWLHVFDATTIPADAAGVPLLPPMKIAAGEMKGFGEELMTGLDCASGIVVGISSTEDVYTAPGTSDGWFYVRYE
jgi:hypothetical protein